MGAYLSEPITKKVSSDEVGKNVAFGASSMQGWRISQEDAHNCCIDFDENVSLFAVYDGHGGHEVATYCANNLPDFIKQTDAYKKGDIRQALIDAFLGFDATLEKSEVVSILKELAGTSTSDKKKEELNESESFSDEDDIEDIDEDESDEDEDEEDEDGDGNIDDDDDDDDSESLMMDTEEPGYDSGCTAVVAILKDNELYVANAGDSRCVLCRDGQAIELSLDHKPEDEPEMERIVKAGGKVTADGRVNGGLNLSRALGDHAYKQNADLPPQEQMISALPDVRHITIEPERDEFMVLACDGIWNFMSSQDVVQFIRARLTQNYEKLSKICEELFDHCLAPDTCGDGTGCDNMTAVIVQFNSSTNAVMNSTITDVCTVKRSLSPSISTEENNDCIMQDDTMKSCKRLKTEATI